MTKPIFLFFLQKHHPGEKYVHQDDRPPSLQESSCSFGSHRYRKNGDGETDKAILHLVALERPLLELQGEQRQLAYQQEAGDENQRQHEIYRPALVGNPAGAAYYQRTPEQRIGWRRYSDERGSLALIQVELRQSQGRESCDDEGYVWQPGAHRLQKLRILHYKEL